MKEKLSPLCVSYDDFNVDFIKSLNDINYISISGEYCLTKADYDNLLVYSNVNLVDVYDIDDFLVSDDIKVNVLKKVCFKSTRYSKFKIDKVNGYEKNILSINLPFSYSFVDDCLYSEEDDFNLLIKYISSLETLNITLDSLNAISESIDIIYKLEGIIGMPIKFINFIVPNVTIPDIEKLYFLEDGRIVKIWYEDGICDCSISEFILMRKNIDKIVDLVNSKNLSPFEQVIYVYDIVKKLNYCVDSDKYSMNGRQLHKIFSTNNIVCSGYARLISEVLNELGIRSGIYKLITKNNVLHARSLVHIIDSKYNINSICSMEPTWESSLKEDNAYSLFLTPISMIHEAFPHDRFRGDVDVLNGTLTLNDISLQDRVSLYQFFNDKDLSQDKIDGYLKNVNSYIGVDCFCEALVNVRVAQGISKNIVISNMSNILEYNRKLTMYLNNKMGTNINFFLN